MTGIQLELPMAEPKGKIWIRDARLANPKFAESFWARVEKWPGRGPNGDCWEWIACVDKSKRGGYGFLMCDGKIERAHRVSWRITNGSIPEGLQVLHSCDNRACVKPSHLFLGTNYDNVQDKIRKGRHPRGTEAAMYSNPKRGEDNWHAKFTDEQVLSMRSMYASGVTIKAIAKHFGALPHVTNMIIHGRRWAHLPGAIPPDTSSVMDHKEEIIALRSQGFLLREIGAKFGYAEATICRVIKTKRAGSRAFEYRGIA